MTPGDVEFIQQLLLGSYAFTAGCYVFGFFVLKALWRIEKLILREQGKTEGLQLDRRVTRLEHRLYAEKN